jgi:hypothetical protein
VLLRNGAGAARIGDRVVPEFGQDMPFGLPSYQLLPMSSEVSKESYGSPWSWSRFAIVNPEQRAR